jgi:hypothetical protein
MKDFIEHLSESPPYLPTIYCDMDGVLADLVGGVSELYGRKLTNRTFDEFVDPMKPKIDEQHPHLFAELPPMPDMRRLWSFISKYHAEILSAPTSSWQPNCRQDKILWVKKNLSPSPAKINLVKREEKQNFATQDGRPNVLIDDWSKNIKEWEAKGGIGILHTNASKTIARLKELGFK